MIDLKMSTMNLKQKLKEICQFKHKVYRNKRITRLETEANLIRNELKRRREEKSLNDRK